MGGMRGNMKTPINWKRKRKLAGLTALIAAAALGLTACADPGQEGNESGGAFVCVDDGTIRQELTALEVVELMGNGINLGNTMEAYGRNDLGTEAEATRYETFWGQSVTTQEMLDGMKAAGFDTLRLPVAWTNMMAFESGDYTINSAYLDR